MANDLTLNQRAILDQLFSGAAKNFTDAVRRISGPKKPDKIAQRLKNSKQFQKNFQRILDKIGLSDEWLGMKIIELLGATREVWNRSTGQFDRVPDYTTQSRVLLIVAKCKGWLAESNMNNGEGDKQVIYTDGEVINPEQERRNNLIALEKSRPYEPDNMYENADDFDEATG